ncbi:MAG: TIGR02996 domain-containing protein [Kofleriaceae bacterium]
MTVESEDERLVHADWLQQRGDPRGELIVVQCALEKSREPKLVAREAELLRDVARWQGAWHGHIERWTMRRGYLDAVAISAGAFARILPDLAEDAPERIHLRSLELLWRGSEDQPQHMFGDRELAQIVALLPPLEALRIVSHELSDAGVAALLAAPWIDSLRELRLDNTGAGDASMFAIAESFRLGALRVLELSTARLTREAAMDIVRKPWLEALVELDLSNVDSYDPWCNRFDDATALAILRCGRVTALERINLDENTAIGNRFAVGLVEAKPPALRELELRSTAIDDSGALALANFAQLERVDMSYTRVGDAGALALATMPALRALHLRGTAITEPGIWSMLEAAPTLWLDVADQALSPELTAVLAKRRPR